VGRGAIWPLGYEMKGGKIAIVEEEAELVKINLTGRYLELGQRQTNCYGTSKSVTSEPKGRLLSNRLSTRGGIPFGPWCACTTC